MIATDFSPRHRFDAWPNKDIPPFVAGVYAIWDGDTLIYCGMAGRSIEESKQRGRTKGGLVSRLGFHASGRLSGDQFCVYVANRLVIPSLNAEQLPRFATGALTLDALTKQYIRQRFEYQFAVVESSEAAYALERACRGGGVFASKPLLNPLKEASTDLLDAVVAHLTDSSTYQKILADGREEGERTIFLKIASHRFGEPDERMRAVIAAASSETLERWGEEYLKVETWQELLRSTDE